LLGKLEPIAAHGGANATGAHRLDGTGRRTAVIGDEVVVVALLAAFLHAVATHGLLTRIAVAHPTRLDGTRRGAALVHAVVGAEVALLVGRDLAIAALRDTPPARVRTQPTVLHTAGVRAAVAGGDITVVALLAAGDLAVATRRHRHARLARCRTEEARLG